MTTATFVSITCQACALTSTVPVDALLVSVAAETSADTADSTDEALPPHPEHPAAGAPMTHDDLLALHELLTTDTWFDQVTTAGFVNP